MSLKKFKPITPGTRHKVAMDLSDITKSTPEKSLLASKKKSGGRNNDGRMTMRYLGGGHKQKYRVIDFKRNEFDIPATVKGIEYDPNRTANIALLFYADGEKRYIIAPTGLKVGDVVISGKSATPNVGNAMYLADVPLGTVRELGSRTDVRIKKASGKLEHFLKEINMLRIPVFAQFYTEERYYRYEDSSGQIQEGTFQR